VDAAASPALVNPLLARGGDLAGAPKRISCRVLYLFAGKDLDTGLAANLKLLGAASNVDYTIDEVDIVRGLQDDLSDISVRTRWLEAIAKGEYDMVIITPPCGSWSRLPWLNKLGPCPCRSRTNPLGFPWATGRTKARAEMGNIWIFFLIEVIGVAKGMDKPCLLLAEHPEDLGYDKSVQPASIFQLDALREACDGFATTCALFQCSLCTPEELIVRDYSKPTRLALASFRHLRRAASEVVRPLPQTKPRTQTQRYFIPIEWGNGLSIGNESATREVLARRLLGVNSSAGGVWGINSYN
jgi:hypothetical protein